MLSKMRCGQCLVLFHLLMVLPAITIQSGHAADNIRYIGTLVAEPCALLPADENIVVDFGTVVDKYLYLYNRTKSQSFELHLIDCDISLGNLLKVTFSGRANQSLPGFLALEGAKGVAIGLETRDSDALPLNKQIRLQELTEGENTIVLKAYVQGEPEAIANKTIERGTFAAIATFTLDYE